MTTTPSRPAEHRDVSRAVPGRHVRGALHCRPGHLVCPPGRGSPHPRLPRRPRRRVLLRRSEEHTSELQSPCNLVCRLLLEKKKKHRQNITTYNTTSSL